MSVSEPPGSDLAAGTGTSGVVAPDSAARGAIREASGWADIDWFSAELAANQAYAVEVLGTSAENCTIRAPLLVGVRDSAGATVPGTSWSAEGRGSYTSLEFTPATAGTYYLEVTGEVGFGPGLGSYILALTEAGENSTDRIAAIGAQGCFPAAPTGLGTSQIAHNSVTLSWTAPDATGVTGYQIWRGTTAGTLSEIVADTGTAQPRPTPTATAAAETTEYHYAVAAVNAQQARAHRSDRPLTTTTPAKPPKNPNQPRTDTPPGATGTDADAVVRPGHAQLGRAHRHGDRLQDLARNHRRQPHGAR